jgi:hypothetical protein
MFLKIKNSSTNYNLKNFISFLCKALKRLINFTKILSAIRVYYAINHPQIISFKRF